MARLHTLLLLLAILPILVKSITSTIRQQVVANEKKIQCNFTLKHTDTEVNTKTSKVSCSPKRPKTITANVELAQGNYSFVGKIRVNPTNIISMDVYKLTTNMGPTSPWNRTTQFEETTLQSNPTSGPEEMEFKKLYENSSSEIMPEYRPLCDTDLIEDNMRKMMGESFTHMSPDEFWDDAVIPWSFVSNGDEFAKYAVHTDNKVGLSKDDVETVMAAMRQIEDKTCIKFNMVRPVKGQPWLFISRDNRGSDLSCQLQYIKSNLVGRDINGVGDIYRRLSYRIKCSYGAYAWYGSSSPQNLVISRTTLSKNRQGSIGLMIHELLHNLGIGHTQKRQDAKETIEIKWRNIKNDSYSQYEACIADKDPRCSRYNTYSTEYDCMSIMHYRDTHYITEEAYSNGGKTMVAKKAGCDLSSPNNDLRNADVEIIRKQYCSNSPLVQVIMSINYPSNYPDNEEKEYPITVDDGHVVKLTFTDLQIEEHESCAFDWLQVVDGDGTILLDRTCGDKKPPQITSKTKSVKINFFSDSTRTGKGFRAEYEAVSSTSGTVKSPNYPENYPDLENLEIPIEVTPGSIIELSFTTLDIEPDASCGYDYVIVLDSNGTRVLAKLCGHSLPSPIRSSGHIMSIVFHSDESINHQGFLATWREVAGVSTGVVTSPGHPGSYPNDEIVVNTISVPEGSRIELTFTALSIEEKDGSCPFDHLTIYDGSTQNDSKLIEICGFTLPDSPVVSTGNAMTLVFVTDGSITFEGYNATWIQI